MTDTASALLSAILDDHDCDLHRMAMADWLEEQGEDARAEFIRAQVELERMGLSHCPQRRVGAHPDIGGAVEYAPCGSCTYCRIRDRMLSVWHDLPLVLPSFARRECLDPVPADWHTSRDPVLFWRRGFIESVLCTWDWWEQHHAEVLACQPVRKVYLTSIPLAILERHQRGTGVVTISIDAPSSPHYLRMRYEAVDLLSDHELLARATLDWLRWRWPNLEFVLPEQGG